MLIGSIQIPQRSLHFLSHLLYIYVSYTTATIATIVVKFWGFELFWSWFSIMRIMNVISVFRRTIWNVKLFLWWYRNVKANACQCVYFGVVLAKKGYVEGSTLVHGRSVIVGALHKSAEVHLAVGLSGCFSVMKKCYPIFSFKNEYFTGWNRTIAKAIEYCIIRRLLHFRTSIFRSAF